MAEENIVLEEQEEVVLTEEELLKRQKKSALTAFILAILSFFLWDWPIVGIILSGIALKKSKAAAGVPVKPHKIFNAIAKPMSIVFLVLSILCTVAATLLLIILLAAGIWAFISFGLPALQGLMGGGAQATTLFLL